MLEYIKLFALALVLTIVIEVGIAWVLGLRHKTGMMTVILINVITNPFLNYLILINGYFHLVQQYGLLIIILEICVVFVEWWLLWFVLRQKTKRMLPLSILMNGASFLTGLLVFKFVFP